MSELAVPLSVLDLAPVSEGSSPADALRNSLALAPEVERLGYHRYWVAEHHNMPGIASSAPAVLLAHIASVTSTIRVGSGGVMLPNHAPLVVAEQFGMLEALHPHRVDLGIGRAPGTDPLTASALRRRGPVFDDSDEFPAQFIELLGYFTGSFPDGHPYRHVTAVPGLGYRPAVWLLGSSDYSARAAGLLGLPFSFAHHFASANTLPALEVYRSSFRSGGELAAPYVMLGVAVICADSDEQAQWLAGPAALSFARLRAGRPGRFPTPEDAAAHEFTPIELHSLRSWATSHVIGSPASVMDKLAKLVALTGADELMLTTLVHGHDDRVRSYQLLAEAAGLRDPERADRAGASGRPIGLSAAGT